MKKHGWIIFLGIVLVTLLVLYTVGYTVEFRQIAIVKTFGKAGEPMYGARGTDGLHWKLPVPFQKLVRYDARTFIFDDAHKEVQTADKHQVLVTMFCAWRIRDAAKFHEQIETILAAEARLRNLLRSTKSSVVGRHPLADFVNTEPAKMKLDAIEGEIHAAVARDAERDYGVEVVAVRFQALGLTDKVSETVINGMKEEREKDVKRLESEGQAEADRIRSRANLARQQILDFARTKAEAIRTQGRIEAAQRYSVYKENVAFAKFLRRLDFLREALKANTVFLLDAALDPSLGYFRESPTRRSIEAPTPPRPAPKADK